MFIMYFVCEINFEMFWEITRNGLSNNFRGGKVLTYTRLLCFFVGS